MKIHKTTVYIAGPMRGFPKYNFDAFDAATARLSDLGYKVISPAEMDRQIGFDPTSSGEPSRDFLDSAMRRDIEAILNHADGLILLPGWEKSTGAKAEMWLARWKHIPVLLYPDLNPLPNKETDVMVTDLPFNGCASE